MAQITCLVCSGRGIVLAHGLVDGAVDVGVDGLAALCRVRLNDLFFAFRHYKIDAVLVIFHIFIYGLLLGLACWGHITTSLLLHIMVAQINICINIQIAHIYTDIFGDSAS